MITTTSITQSLDPPCSVTHDKKVELKTDLLELIVQRVWWTQELNL